MSGKLIIFSGPSGSGKTTIVHHLLNIQPNLKFSISATSRPKRLHEVEGKDYYFLSKEAFIEKIKNNEFIEWEEVYEGFYYGTLRSDVERIWNTGKHVVFDVDVKGGLKLKKIYTKKALAIFVKPPSVDELKKRLNKRSTESAESLAFRIQRANEELSYANQFDIIITNNTLNDAQEEALKIVTQFLNNSL